MWIKVIDSANAHTYIFIYIVYLQTYYKEARQPTGPSTTYRFTAIQIEQENGASFAFQQFPSLGQNFGYQTFQIVLLFENTPRQIQ